MKFTDKPINEDGKMISYKSGRLYSKNESIGLDFLNSCHMDEGCWCSESFIKPHKTLVNQYLMFSTQMTSQLHSELVKNVTYTHTETERINNKGGIVKCQDGEALFAQNLIKRDILECVDCKQITSKEL